MGTGLIGIRIGEIDSQIKILVVVTAAIIVGPRAGLIETVRASSAKVNVVVFCAVTWHELLLMMSRSCAQAIPVVRIIIKAIPPVKTSSNRPTLPGVLSSGSLHAILLSSLDPPWRPFAPGYFAALGGSPVDYQDVVPVKTQPSVPFPGPSRAKDGAVSPRLGNRYGRFSFRTAPATTAFMFPRKRNDVLKDHSRRRL
jgi:hypothetical protein